MGFVRGKRIFVLGLAGFLGSFSIKKLGKINMWVCPFQVTDLLAESCLLLGRSNFVRLVLSRIKFFVLNKLSGLLSKILELLTGRHVAVDILFKLAQLSLGLPQSLHLVDKLRVVLSLIDRVSHIEISVVNVALEVDLELVSTIVVVATLHRHKSGLIGVREGQHNVA